MIRIHYSNKFPYLAAVGNDGRHVGIIVNPDVQGWLSLRDKERLFNVLMAELNSTPGARVASPEVEASAVIIDLEAALARRSSTTVHCPRRRSHT